MENAIEVRNLCKQYKGFSLDNVSFTVPRGYVCGFIGQNGAGKTTTLKLLLGMVTKDSGETMLLSPSETPDNVKEDIGVLFDQPYYQADWTPRQIEKALRPFYNRWDGRRFHEHLQRFSLDAGQKFKTFSRGMKMKLGLAVALSHDAKLLLLEEPTSGLDPVMRDQLLDILRGYMAEEDRTVFFSSHITSDLEKVADYLVYIHQGKVLYSGLKDDLLEKYCIVRGPSDELPAAAYKKIIGYRAHIGGFDGMMDIADTGGLPPSVITEKATLDDIMVHMDRNGGLV